MAYTSVIFDVGLTLVKPEPDVMCVYARVARDCGCFDMPDDIESRDEIYLNAYEHENSKNPLFWSSSEGCHASWQAIYEEMAFVLGHDEKASEIASGMIEGYTGSQYWALYDDVKPCLEELVGRGADLSILSNWNVDLPGILDDIGLAPYFSSATISSFCGLSKPMREIFDLHLSSAGIERASALYVGDSVSTDVLGAMNADIRPVLVDRDGRYKNVCLPDDVIVIPSLAELPRFVTDLR